MSIYVPPRPDAAAKAGPVGPGAGVLMTEYALPSILQQSPQRKMWLAAEMSVEVPWIRAAERVITGLCSTVDWHLEDGAGEEVGDGAGTPDAQAAYRIVEFPQATVPVGTRMTRRAFWAKTFRHIGVCGNAFWLLDQLDGMGRPGALLYLDPWRMTPAEDAAGNLTGWVIDKRADQGSGIAVPLAQVRQFVLDPPDRGHFGIGLVESAMLKAQLSQAADRHVAQVLSAGGRLSGLLSPKPGDFIDDDQYKQLVADGRNLAEQPDAAKRMQIIRVPVDWTQTTMTLDEIKARDLMVGLRDDLLGLWGAPLSQVGGTPASGMNSGDTRKYDEAALWQGANHPRIVAFREVAQTVLDLWLPQTVVGLEVEEPEFDDDSPRYDLLAKSVNTPLTNAQRLELIGLPPSGDPSFDNEVLLPATIVPYRVLGAVQADQGPSAAALGRGPEPEAEQTAAGSAAGETAEGKARLHGLHRSLAALRSNVDRAVTPRLREDVRAAMAAQRRDVARRIREHEAHIAAKPGDTSVWWPAASEDRRMAAALRPHLAAMAQSVADHVASALPPVPA